MHPHDLAWLLAQIRECMTLIDHDPERWMRLINALAGLYLEWSER